MKIIIGYDGSECAGDALVDLRRAGLPADTEALVLTVADIIAPVAGPRTEPDLSLHGDVALAVGRARARAGDAMAEARELAEGGASRLRELFPGWAVRAEASADAPHWALVGSAARSGADLIVIGSHGRSALGRVLLGSVSQQVLHHAPCSVRIARCASKAAVGVEQPVRLVLGIDGSADSATAVSAVGSRHWPAGSEVLVVGVVDSSAVISGLSFEPGGAGYADSSDRAALLEGSLESAGEKIRTSGLSVTTSYSMGNAKRGLLSEAERHGADCIFVGAKGHSRLERVLLGSVSSSVAAEARCTVEVVRTKA
ncbi:MAG: Universal stress protein UspA-like nucleotide-binding protein [Phycisphaerales bacterium]|nr:Universal stress protein UspA-like nucleotide-binding protein [Phycisphaerales bacterium]